VSEYDDRTAAYRAGLSRGPGPGAARRDDYSRDYPYDQSDEQGYSDEQSYDDAGYSNDTTVLAPPRGFEDDERPQWKLGWNSGADVGLLLMRLVLGAIFAAHGAQKVFGWFGGPGLDGFARILAEQGFEQTDVLSAAVGFAEVVGGLLVVLGVFTPLAAAGLLGVMINAIWLKWHSGLFVETGGFELELALAALAAGIVLTGPGRVAMDNGRAWFRHSVATGWVCLFLGAGAAVAVRVLFHGL
jgi:putative oxidoreductase